MARKRGEAASAASALRHRGSRKFAKAVQAEHATVSTPPTSRGARFLRRARHRWSGRGGSRRGAEHANNDTEDPLLQIFRGRVERLLGNEREALHIFREVLQFQPENTDAISEARVLEQRLENKGSGSGIKKR